MWAPEEIPLPRFLLGSTPILLTFRNRTSKVVRLAAEEWRPLAGALLDSLVSELEPGAIVTFSVQVGSQLLLTLDDVERHFLRQPTGGLPSWSPGGGSLALMMPRELKVPELPSWSIHTDVISSSSSEPPPDALRSFPKSVEAALERIIVGKAFIDLPTESAYTVLVVKDAVYVIAGTALFFDTERGGTETLEGGGKFSYSIKDSFIYATIATKEEAQPLAVFGDIRRFPIRVQNRHRVIYILQPLVS